MTAAQMISELETLSKAKLEASLNSDEARQRSPKNASRHGVTGQVACMPDPDRHAFSRFCAAIVEDYRPEGAIETQLAQTIAEDYWRLNRARAWETNTLTYGSFDGTDRRIASEHPQVVDAFTQILVVQKQSAIFARIALYETRINRNIEKNEKRLKARQAERRAAFEQAVEEAKLLTEPEAASLQAESSEAENRPGPIPQKTDSQLTVTCHGFVLSTAKIHAALARRTRLEAAKLRRPPLRNAA